MTGTPTMRVRQVFISEAADFSVYVVTDTEDATLDAGIVTNLSQADASVIRVDNREDADEFIKIVEGTILPSSGPSHLLLDGSPGTYASTPDKAALDLTGDMDLRIAVAMDDWGAGWGEGGKWWLGKWDVIEDGPPSRHGFTFDMRGFSNDGIPVIGAPTLAWVSAASGPNNLISEVGTGASDGELICVAGTLEEEGGGGLRATYYIKATTPATAAVDLATGLSTWTLLFSGVDPSASFPLLTSIRELAIGSDTPEENFDMMAGKVYVAVVKDGVNGTTVASPDFTAQPPGTTSFSDAQGNVWSLSGNAAIA